MTLPSVFCWTRFGIEAGERTCDIFARKELERRRNGGVFLWGIGSSIRPSVASLVTEQPDPEVLFSPMLTKPANKDVQPTKTVLWTSALDLEGRDYVIPEWSIVTSALRSGVSANRHYALVCHSETPINESAKGSELRLHEMRNLLNNTQIGSSQVTCVVRNCRTGCSCGPMYQVALVAQLIPPYFVILREPLIVPNRDRLDRLDGDQRLLAAEQLIKLRLQKQASKTRRSLSLALTG